MAGIFERLGDILSANINALLDKAEDPGKMVDQYLRNAKEDLAEVRKNTAGVMAEEKRCQRNVQELEAEAAELEQYAQKAVLAGNDMLCCTDFEKQIPAVLEAVQGGIIERRQIERAAERVLIWKIELGILS